MPITLVTGLPGHGKTLWTLARLKPLAEAEKRPVFHASGKPVEGQVGIPGLAIEGWQAQNPFEWFDLPPSSYMVVDECQKVFPIRARSAAVPKHVEELETHRHKGLDLYLVTQHPQLVDSHVRKLVDRHFHIVRKFGTKMATIYEFPSGVQDAPEKNKQRNGVVRHEWRYPKKVFEWYRSAEVHTVKSRLPMKFWLFLAVLVLAPVLMYFAYRQVFGHQAKPGAAAAGSAASAPGYAASRVAPAVVDARAASMYLDSMRPRIPGLAFTAPAYDSLTKPVEAPYPSVCAYSPEFPCRCWSQRGFSLDVPKNLCEQLAREPMDPYWLRRGPHGLERPGEGGEVGRDSDGQLTQARAPAAPVAMPAVLAAVAQ